MRQLGKKKAIQDGTLVAFGCPCDCTSICSAPGCIHCPETQGAQASMQVVERERALAYGGTSVVRQLSGEWG